MIWLLIVSVMFASLNSVYLHKIKLNNSGLIYKFNLICSFTWCVILFVTNGCKLSITTDSLLFGFIYGISQTLFILSKTAAMNNGPVSVTTLIGNSSLVISILVCLFLWNEPVLVTDIIGLVLLTTGIVLCTYKKSEQKYSKLWKVNVIFFLIFSASVGITFKAFSKYGDYDNAGDMLLIAAIVMTLLYSLICCFISNYKCKNVFTDRKELFMFIRYALLSGILSCFYNRLNIYLSGVLDGVVFFPVFNGGVILLSTVLAILLLKEKPLTKQLIGILIGISGICVIGIL